MTRGNERARRSETEQVLAMTVAVVAAAALVHLIGVWPAAESRSDVRIPWPFMVVAFAVVEFAVVHLHLRRSSQIFSFSELPLIVGLFLMAPQVLVMTRIAGTVVALTVQRQRPIKLMFNMASVWLETAVAITLFHAVVGDASALGVRGYAGAFVAAVGAGMLGTVMVALVSMLHDEQAQPGMLRWLLGTGAASVTANTSLGLLAVTLLHEAPAALVLLLVVLTVVFAAYRGYSTVYRRHEDLELLYEFTRALGGEVHVDKVGQRLLTRARDLLSADRAELILEDAAETGPAVLLRVTPDGHLERLEEDPRSRDLRRRVVGEQSKVLPRTTREQAQRAFLGHFGLKDAVLVRMHIGRELAGTILVGDRHGEVTTFGAQDLRLLETLANHASVALANGRLVDRLTRQAAEREHEALHDALTGLPNRTLFQRELAEVIAEPGAKAAVLLMDLNGFKDVNDTLGHQAGDLLLRDISGRLARALEGTGTVARLGGDEFSVLLPGVGGELAAKTVAHELLGVLEHQATIEGVRVDIGASIGITLSPLHGDEATALLRRADVAMYAAKDTHSPVVVYTPERDFHSPERLALAAELRTTLERGELRVVYQPKADLRTGRVVGVEALARWSHPERGFIPPDIFVGVAERGGLHRQLTRHVMRSALTQCRIWRLSGLPLNVSINLSARSLLPELPEEVGRILGETGVAASALTLEITESSIMADPVNTGQVLEQLSRMGVTIAIDDFGTGYSSLTYLKRLPVDEIKIDKSFVLGMSRDEDDAAIVRSTVDLGRNLGLRVVAEGIEDAATWTALTTLGCDMAQGYYLSPPVTPVEFDAWLRSRISNMDAAHTATSNPLPVVPPHTS